MSIYAEFTSGTNISELPAKIQAQQEAIRGFERGANATPPTVLVTGLLWNRTDYPSLDEVMMRYNGTSFVLLMDVDFAQINAGGTVPWAANQPMATKIFTGLGAGSVAGHSVRYEQVLLLSGANPMGADLAMGNNKITGLKAPTANDDAARKVDAEAAKPVSGTVSVGTSGATVNVELGFVPSIVIVTLRSTTNNRVVLSPATFITGAVDANELKSTILESITTGSLVASLATNQLTRRSTTPVTGFTYRNNVTTAQVTDHITNNPDALVIDYVAFR